MTSTKETHDKRLTRRNKSLQHVGPLPRRRRPGQDGSPRERRTNDRVNRHSKTWDLDCLEKMGPSSPSRVSKRRKTSTLWHPQSSCLTQLHKCRQARKPDSDWRKNVSWNYASELCGYNCMSSVQKYAKIESLSQCCRVVMICDGDCSDLPLVSLWTSYLVILRLSVEFSSCVLQQALPQQCSNFISITRATTPEILTFLRIPHFGHAVRTNIENNESVSTSRSTIPRSG